MNALRTLARVVRALAPRLDGLEASCFDGRYITGDVSAEDFARIEAQRRAQPADEDAAGRSPLALQGTQESNG